MKWEDAIERYAKHKSMMAKVHNLMEMKRRVMSDLRLLLKQIPELVSRDLKDITPEIWHSAINTDRKREGYNWDVIGDRTGYSGKYNDLVRCIIFAKSSFTCRYCGRGTLRNPSLQLHLEHIEPRSTGGDWFALDNLGCACRFCNLGKQVMGEDEFREELGEIARSVMKRHLNSE